MTALNKQALREAAERAESDSWGYDRDEFNEALTPSTVLALLDELEAKDSMIAAQQHEIRTLLNALEGRPCPKCNDTGMADSGGTQPWGEPISVPCDCAAPPAPVSVPDAIHSQGEKSASDDYYALGWNACRAAMLQGAEPASQPYTLRDGWVAVPVEPTAEMIEATFAGEMELQSVQHQMRSRERRAHYYRAMLAVVPDFREISNSSTKHFRENTETSTSCQRCSGRGSYHCPQMLGTVECECTLPAAPQQEEK
ncbi:ead/Ea22-like family protein [Enterobacter hormaechei]|uniref:ead/Ea22-like family protein n=1 Tax=Enterobacter hormaechei TaxID=158836 RepID=UPI0023F89986|nr:ead/Ea22-like family protein [Enterobacter hormaechei]MDF7702722.1 ead/Ea22-like family protein [Enterobacter hormaechei subsp. steigerwaltii]